MYKLISLVRSAAIFAAFGVLLLGAATLTFRADTAYASGPGSGGDDDSPDYDDPDYNDPDFDEPDFDEPDYDDHGDDDFDSSGPGNGRDDDEDFGEVDNSGPGSENSGSGGGDDFDNSGPGSFNSGHDDAIEAIDHAIAEAVDAYYAVDHDEFGNEYVAGEIILVGTRHDLRLARNRGFTQVRVEQLESGGVLALLITPSGLSMREAVETLSTAAPRAVVTPNNLYRGAQSLVAGQGSRSSNQARRIRGTVGVIDTGVDANALPARDALLGQRAFASDRPVAREHGSMVASIAIERGAHVYVADVFGQGSDGALAASAERIAAAIDWMIEHRVPVINISVEGPDNGVLEEMIRRATRRGHIIVAAAGNGGPNARPSFPAAFDGVLAVTAIDDTGRPYVRANRGEYIDFAAHGVDVNVAVGDSVVRVSGTSFAAPVIAAEAAADLHEPSPAASARVLTQMQGRAEDLGSPGRDHIFGWGALRD